MSTTSNISIQQAVRPKRRHKPCYSKYPDQATPAQSSSEGNLLANLSSALPWNINIMDGRNPIAQPT